MHCLRLPLLLPLLVLLSFLLLPLLLLLLSFLPLPMLLLFLPLSPLLLSLLYLLLLRWLRPLLLLQEAQTKQPRAVPPEPPSPPALEPCGAGSGHPPARPPSQACADRLCVSSNRGGVGEGRVGW